ncbi:Myb/SANT-like domain-containing protein [Tanacetum coccineum]
MEDSLEDNSQHKKIKSIVGWKNISVVKTFIKACIHAIDLDGRECVSLKVLSWKKVAKALKDNHNFEADQKQMRNHFDYMNLKYEAWLSLKNKASIKGGGPSLHEPVYVGDPHMFEDADATKVPNTESSKATSKAPCAVKNKRKRRQPIK